MKKVLNFKALALILYLVSLVIVGDLESETNSILIRYYKYSLTLLPFFYYLLSDKKITTRAIYPFLAIIFIFIWSFIFNIGLTITNLFSIIVLLAVLPAFLFKWNFNFDETKLELSFYFIGLIFFGINLFSIINQNFTNFMLSGRSSDSESFLFPFVLGLIAFYFFSINKKISFLVFLLLTFLTGKRGVFLALSIVCFIQIIFPRKFIFKYRILFGLTLNLLSLIFIYLFSIGFFNDLLYEILDIKSIGAFSAGRSSINGFVFDYYENLSIFDKMVGIGFGEISKHIGDFFFMGNSWNAHNEILRLLVEIGFLGLVIFIIIFYKYTEKESVFLFMFINIVMLFTNIFIYPVVIFIFYLISTLLNYKKKYDNYSGFSKDW